MRQVLLQARDVTGAFSARLMLKAATSDLHVAVDERFSGPFDTDRQAYVGFLTALARVIPPLEDALERGGVGRLFPDWQDRRRTAALRDDLDRLGRPMPTPARVSPPINDAEMMGMLYVLEGSRLGGRMLLGRARANPDPEVRAATRYLAHSGSGTWPAFVERLETSPAIAAAPQDAVLGARAAFILFASQPVEAGAGPAAAGPLRTGPVGAGHV